MDIYHEAYCLRQGPFNFSFGCDIFGCPIWEGQIALTKALMAMIMFLFAVAITEATNCASASQSRPNISSFEKSLAKTR